MSRENLSADIAPESLTQDWAGHTLDMAGALLLVLAAVFFVSLLLKHLQSRVSPGGSHLKVLQALSLGTKDRVLLVQVGVDQILMGVSSAGITHLHTLSEPVDTPNADPASDQKTTPSFAATIKNIAGKHRT